MFAKDLGHSDPMDGRKALAKAFGDYVDDHRLTQTDVAAKGGPSTTSQTKIMTTVEPLAPQTLQKIDKVTGWSPGTSARILAGNPEPSEQRTIEQFSNAELVDRIHRLVDVVSRRLPKEDGTDAYTAEAHQKSADEVDGADAVVVIGITPIETTPSLQPAPDLPPA